MLKDKIKKVNLIIPMSGIGKRFADAGYIDHKSLLKIDGKNMLERIFNKFENVEIFLITTKLIVTELRKNDDWLILENKINLILIKDHKLGPAYTIFKAFEEIPKGIGTYISYCDITWQWDENFFIDEKIEAAIFCHYCFHPHLVNNNFSAFCKPTSEKKNKLKKIKEKESFTSDWMNEPLSIGLFYVNDFEKLRLPLYEMIRTNKKVANEFYPSILFNYLIDEGIEVDLIPVDSFVHYGAPLQFEDINSWAYYIKYYSKKNKVEESNFKEYSATIMISGTGSRMKSVSKEPKFTLKAGKYSMLEHVINSLPIKKSEVKLISNQSDDERFLLDNIDIYKIGKTSSQFDSLKHSKEHFKKETNFFLCSCDCFGFFDKERFDNLTEVNSSEVIIFGFKPSLMQLQLKSSFSTFCFKDDLLTKINVKKIPENDFYGLAGFFWFKDGNSLNEAVNMLEKNNEEFNREIIIDDVIEFMRLMKVNISYIPLSKYIHLGTPEEYNEFNYWSSKIPTLL